MGMWSKGLERVQSGELRKESAKEELVNRLTTFVNGVHVGSQVKVTLTDENEFFIKFGYWYTIHFEPIQLTHLNVMEHFLKSLDRLLNYKDLDNASILRHKIQRNIRIYKDTCNLKDLYDVE